MASLSPAALSFLLGTVSNLVPRNNVSNPPFQTGANLYAMLQSVAFGSYYQNGAWVTTQFPGRIPVLQEQVSSYYASAQLYQQNVANLTTALSGVNGGDYNGTATTYTWYTGYITTTNSLETFSSTVWMTANIKDYVATIAGGSLNQTNDSTVALQVNSQTINALISTQQNLLANEQTFLNSAVNSIQSEVALVGQILQAITQVIQQVISATR